MQPDSEDTVKFQFHALVTVDDQGFPCGEASTDLAAVMPDGRLSQAFDHISGDGYGIAQVSFEVEVPVSKMWFGCQVLQGQLVEPINHLYLTPAENEPKTPATIDAVEPRDDDVDFGCGPSTDDDEDFGPIDFGNFEDEE